MVMARRPQFSCRGKNCVQRVHSYISFQVPCADINLNFNTTVILLHYTGAEYAKRNTSCGSGKKKLNRTSCRKQQKILTLEEKMVS
jgi:hypothetical protein